MSTDTITRTFEQLGQGQLEIYARELQEHFTQERQLRRQLEERNLQLERRLREIAAIERMNQTIYQQNIELSLVTSGEPSERWEMQPVEPPRAGPASELSEDVVLQRVVNLGRELVHAKYCALVVFEEGVISSFLASGLDAEERKSVEAVLRDRGFQGMLNWKAQPTRLKDLDYGRRWITLLPDTNKMTCLLGIPIVHKGRYMGNLYMIDKQDAQEFSQEDESLMVMFATQAAVAIENTRIYQQGRAEAIQEERDRIGKDLHDSIIQSIYAVGLNLESCTEIVAENPPEVKDRLKVAVNSLNQVITNIRNYIMDLLPKSVAEKTLRERLRALAEEFSHNSRIRVDLQLGLQEDPGLASSQTNHLLAIAREGLTNVAKHASARSAILGLSHNDEMLRLWIQDGGAGFNPKLSRSGRKQGLRNMKERAEALRAKLVIKSSPGHGTRLEVRLPLHAPTPRRGPE